MNIPNGSAAKIEDGLRCHFADRPAAIAWGVKDPAFTPRWRDLWLKTFPHADVLRLPDAGHYLQEDAHERIVPALLRFLGPAGRALTTERKSKQMAQFPAPAEGIALTHFIVSRDDG